MSDTTNTIIPVGNEVRGDITSCKIENQLIMTQRNSAFSITEYNTYAAYNVCDKRIINQYSVSDFTGMGLLYIAVGIIVFWIAVASMGDRY